jgi:hypothetical protein
VLLEILNNGIGYSGILRRVAHKLVTAHACLIGRALSHAVAGGPGLSDKKVNIADWGVKR